MKNSIGKVIFSVIMTDMIDFDIAALSAAELAELVRYHNRRYWELGEPEIPDARYDELVEALRRADPENPLLEEVQTPAVAAEGKVRHAEPMLSLDKAYSLDAVLEWARKFARSPREMLLVEPKYDGISVNYDGKVLSTRGDGAVGEDVSGKIPIIELEAPEYRGPLDRPARGELLIRKDDFAELYSHIRKKGGGTYKNPRNAVAGIMGLKEISAMREQGAKLTLADYRLVSFAVPLDELERRWEELKFALAQLPYPQDGIVIKFADRGFAESLGNTAHHPRGAIAYKFTNQRAETTLLGVEWSFGKNCLTPVARLAPVELSGITIKRATLHNAQNLVDLGVMIGDTVVVERAGDVIPYIAECRPGEERRSPFITECPCCGSRLERRGPELVCPSPDCFETRLQRLLAALKALGIERLGEPTLRKMMRELGVVHLTDLFKITAADLRTKLDGFQEKSAANLIEEIRKARRVEEFRVLASLNIAGIGLNVARSLLAGRTLAELRTMSAAELAGFDGIGPERAAALAREFDRQREYLDELLAAVEPVRGETAPGDAPTVCFTGKMPEKRSYYEVEARKRGYLPVDSAGRGLSLLVAADPQGASTKLDKARKLGIRIVTPEEFLSLPPAAVNGNAAAAPDAAPPTEEAPVPSAAPDEPDSSAPVSASAEEPSAPPGAPEKEAGTQLDFGF